MSDLPAEFEKQFKAAFEQAWERNGSRLRNTVRKRICEKGTLCYFEELTKADYKSDKVTEKDVLPLTLLNQDVRCNPRFHPIADYCSVDDMESSVDGLSDECQHVAARLAWAHGRAMDARIIGCLEALKTPPTVGDDTDGLTLRKIHQAITMLRCAGLLGDKLCCVVDTRAWGELMRMAGFACAPSDDSGNFKKWLGVTWIAHPELDEREKAVGEGGDARAVANCYMYHEQAVAIAIERDISVECSKEAGKPVRCCAKIRYGVKVFAPRGIVRIPVRNDTI